MLEVRALDAFYGSSQVLFGVALKLKEGRVLTVLGRNGTGRTTLARALVGRVVRRGSVRFMGRELIDECSFRIARAGVSYVPENREVFDQLNVKENLQLEQRVHVAGAVAAWSVERCYEPFPRLGERRLASAGALSGGEQRCWCFAGHSWGIRVCW